jgi:hypothetical protein
LIDLKKQFGEKYRVRWDEAKKAGGWTKADHPWLMQIVGATGFISLHTPTALAVVAIGKRKSLELAKLAGIDLKLPISQQSPRPGWRTLQFGDWELRCAFPIEEIDAVARLLGVKKRKPATPEASANRAAALDQARAKLTAIRTRGPLVETA